MSGKKLTIGTVGVGAVGTVLSGRLVEAGAKVVVNDLPQLLEEYCVPGIAR